MDLVSHPNHSGGVGGHLALRGKSEIIGKLYNLIKLSISISLSVNNFLTNNERRLKPFSSY